MTSVDKRELGKYVRALADLTGLRDWHFEYSVTKDHPKGGMDYTDDEGTHSALGSCEPVPGQRKAILRFHPDLRTEPIERMREVVVHELVHCHFAQLREFARTGLASHLGELPYRLFMFGHDMAWEHAIDAIAYAWAQALPMIKWPQAKAKK